MRRPAGLFRVAFITTAILGSQAAVPRPTPAQTAGADPAGDSAAQQGEWLTRAQLVEDVGQLVDFYERTHPDPYIDGKLSFHRRVHELLRRLPDPGLSRDEFHSRLQLLLAGRGDGHTAVRPLRSIEGGESSPGLPIDFKVLASGVREPVPALFVQGIAGVPHTYAGSRVVSVAGVPIAEVIERERPLAAYENESSNLSNLVWRLWSEKGLRELLPEWRPGDSVRVGLLTPAGATVELTLQRGRPPRTWDGEGLGRGLDVELHLPESRAGEPVYRFLDGSRRTALLRLDNTWAHRELFEPLIKGIGGREAWARSFYRLYHGEGAEAPENVTELVRALPSAAEIFQGLVTETKAAGTETLIVDLRRNSGGSSVLVNMLLYYLYGRQGWSEFFGNMYTIRRLTAADVDGAADSAAEFPARVGDYDFSREFSAGTETPSEAGNEEFLVSTTIDFARELESGGHEGYYAPPRVVGVVSPRTSSGGFWVAAALRRMGALLVGVPSGQAGNAFANAQTVTLAQSGISAAVSSRLFVLFPEEPGLMPVLPVDVPLTFEAWRDTGWAPNASLLLALHTTGG